MCFWSMLVTHWDMDSNSRTPTSSWVISSTDLPFLRRALTACFIIRHEWQPIPIQEHHLPGSSRKNQLESVTANYKIHFPSRIRILDWGTEWLWGRNVCHTSVRIRVWISRTYISLDVVVCVSAVPATCQANGRGRQETAQKLMANTHEIHSRIPFWNEKLMFTDKMPSGAW